VRSSGSMATGVAPFSEFSDKIISFISPGNELRDTVSEEVENND